MRGRVGEHPLQQRVSLLLAAGLGGGGLVERVRTLRAAAARQAARQHVAHEELERMLADPPAHKWRRLSNPDLGRPGCTTYHVRPRAGLLGMLMGWWQVKVSGGCPLPG